MNTIHCGHEGCISRAELADAKQEVIARVVEAFKYGVDQSLARNGVTCNGIVFAADRLLSPVEAEPELPTMSERHWYKDAAGLLDAKAREVNNGHAIGAWAEAATILRFLGTNKNARIVVAAATEVKP